MKKRNVFFVGAALGVSALLSTPAQAQLLNGNFANGLSHWVTGGKGVTAVTSVGHAFQAGSHDVKLGGADVGILQHVAGLITGDKYKIAGEFLGTGTGVHKYLIGVTGAIHHLGGDTVKVTGPFAYKAFSFSGTAAGTKLTYALAGEVLTGTGHVFFDDAQLINLSAGVPEIDAKSGAAPMALALGGLVLMTDRRRRSV
jgi:hypothetical protein